MIVDPAARIAAPDRAAEIRRGFLAMLPLWAGIIPFALTFGLLARTAGFSPLETQALSMLVFAGSAQIAIVTLYASGASAVVIVATALVLNLRHLLYGLSLSRDWSRPTSPPLPPILALFLTDESYGVAIKDRLDGRGGPAFFFGASFSLYLVYAVGTLVGALVGQFIPDPRGLGLDFVFPLIFVALLIPLLRGWRQCVVAALAAITVLLLSRIAPGGVAIVGAAITAAGVGVALDHFGPQQQGNL